MSDLPIDLSLSQRTTIQPSGSRDSMGRLLSSDLKAGVLLRGIGLPPKGLYLTLKTSGDSTQDSASVIRLTVGRQYAGGEVERLFHLTRRGVWLSVAGWGTVKVVIEALAAGAEVQFAWTSDAPPEVDKMVYYGTVGPGVVTVQPGAEAVVANVTDTAASQSVGSGNPGDPLTVKSPLTEGELTPVFGGHLNLTQANVLAWILRAP